MKRIRAAVTTSVALLACMTLGALHGPGARAQTQAVLPDSTVLARVDSRVIRVLDFRDRYFSVDAGSKPAPDSTGRRDFLKTMVDKEVMGLTAQMVNRPLAPHDELVMRQHVAKMLAFFAVKRNVQDPVVVTEKELREFYAEQSWELRLRYLLLPDEATAQFVRSKLLRGQIAWLDAATRYSLGPDSLREGDLGWRSRFELQGTPRSVVYKLRPPGISEVTRDEEGFKIWQCLGRRPAQIAPYMPLRRGLLRDLRADREAVLEREFMAKLSERARPHYDTTNIVWLAERFRIANASLGEASASTMDMRSRAPAISATDTSRVLATADRARVTCGRFLTAYRDIPPLGRQRIQTPGALFSMLQRMALEPAVVTLAMEQGLLRDSEFVAQIAKKREGLLVQHLYEDSIETKIQVTESMRRDYYQANSRNFTSPERVVYAIIPRLTETGADSVIALLNAGKTAREILAGDSLMGMTKGSIRELLEGQHHTYYNLLFAELRAGESTKEYLGADKLWVVLHIVSHVPAKQLPYAEARDLVDRAVENATAEQVLAAFIARRRTMHRIESHPELLSGVLLVDPSSDWNISEGD